VTVEDAVIVLQARMASTRLPGKAMQEIAGRSVLARCLSRLQASVVAPVVLATTENPEDDVCWSEADRAGVRCLRGSASDVLARFAFVARVTRARYIVRATADNPAVDIDAPCRVLRALVETGADYVVEHGLPHGAAVEAVSCEALERAHREARWPADREHVTTFIKRERDRFALVDRRAPERVGRPDLRLTIDTADDLRFMTAVLSDAECLGGDAPLVAIIASADRVVSGMVLA
jgi:spore coat polysaccharide biosynthesis protein SpsF